MLTDNFAAPLILVVEDDNSHALLIQRSFEEVTEEYRLERVGTIRAAKAAIEKHAPGLVLTDYQLPGGDGSEMVALAAGACPVIMMTSHGNEQIAVEAMKIGVQDYIVKSAEAFEALPRTVAQALKVWSLIQSRRQAEKVLRAKESRHAKMLANIGDVIVIIDKDGINRYKSPNIEKWFGWKPEELMGASTWDVVHPEDLEPSQKFIGSLMSRPGSTGTTECRYLCKDGSYKWIEITLSNLLDDPDIQGFLGNYHDISERRQTLNTLKESEEKHRVLFESAADAIFVHDEKARMLAVNPLACERLGYTQAELMSLTINQVDTPEQGQYAPDRIARLIEHGHLAFETVHQRKDGSSVPTEVSSRKVFWDGKPAMMSICRDITERKRAEEELKKLEQHFQQAQKLECLGVLAGGIAHDFNNILAIIMGYCSLTKMDFESAEENIPQIEKAVERAAALCRQMLAYAGKAALTQSQVNLWMLVDEMVSMLKATINPNVSILPDLPTNIPFINGDASQLRQVVMNLIINASESIGEAQGNIHVSLAKTAVIAGQTESDHLGKVITPGHYVCIKVSDTGCGMNDETKLRIFDPFYTTKITGHGLGMSAVLGIITAHKGALQFSSQPGKGTTFKVYLPVQTSDAVGESSLQQASPEPWQGRGTILLVDDEEQVLMIAKIILKKLGFGVIDATNGKEALELYQKNATDITLVLTDMGMPVMDGYELFRELKKLNPELPIIISSGYGDTIVTSRIPSVDIAGLVNKPYNFDQLLVVLRGVVEGVSR